MKIGWRMVRRQVGLKLEILVSTKKAQNSQIYGYSLSFNRSNFLPDILPWWKILVLKSCYWFCLRLEPLDQEKIPGRNGINNTCRFNPSALRFDRLPAHDEADSEDQKRQRCCGQSDVDIWGEERRWRFFFSLFRLFFSINLCFSLFIDFDFVDEILREIIVVIFFFVVIFVVFAWK